MHQGHQVPCLLALLLLLLLLLQDQVTQGPAGGEAPGPGLGLEPLVEDWGEGSVIGSISDLIEVVMLTCSQSSTKV